MGVTSGKKKKRVNLFFKKVSLLNKRYPANVNGQKAQKELTNSYQKEQSEYNSIKLETRLKMDNDE